MDQNGLDTTILITAMIERDLGGGGGREKYGEGVGDKERELENKRQVREHLRAEEETLSRKDRGRKRKVSRGREVEFLGSE